LGAKACRRDGLKPVGFSRLAAEGERIRRPDPSAARTVGVYSTRRSLESWPRCEALVTSGSLAEVQGAKLPCVAVQRRVGSPEASGT
jgi:hypothetical protein